MTKKTPKKSWTLILSAPRVSALVFVMGFALVGTLLLFTSGASAPPSEFQAAFDRSLCMDNLNNSSAANNPVEIRTCADGNGAEIWSLVNVTGGLQIKSSAGTCAADPGNAVGTNSSNRVYVKTAVCNSGDHAQIWKWSGAQLQNAYNNGCINDPGSSTGQGTWLAVYACSPVTNNAEWDRVAVTIPNPSVSVTAPAAGATVSGTGVKVAASASVEWGSITNITLKVAGATVGSCANITTCSVTWNSKSHANGVYTIQATATASGGGSSEASESIKVSNAAAPSPSPSPSPKPGPTIKIKSSGSTGSVSIAPLTNGDNADVSVSQAPDTSTVNDSGGTQTSATGPTVYDIVSTSITANSISISWQASSAGSYTVKYGPNKNKLANTRTVKSTDPEPSLTISGLSADTRIYVSITPHGDGASGATVSTSFTTLKATSHMGAVIGWTLLLVVLAAGALLLRRKLHTASDTYGVPSDTPAANVQHLQLYPQEDSAAQAARVNWWLPDEQRQAIAHHQQPQPQAQQPAEQYPDMFEEGRKRLEEAERQRPPDV